MATYNSVMRPALEYASYIWLHLAYSTSMYNSTLRTATGCTRDTNIQHLHDETLILPIHEHLQLDAPQYKHKTQHPSHTTYFNTPMRNTLYSTTVATQQTFPHTPTHSLQHTLKQICTIYTHILCLGI